MGGGSVGLYIYIYIILHLYLCLNLYLHLDLCLDPYPHLQVGAVMGSTTTDCGLFLAMARLTPEDSWSSDAGST